MAALDLKARGLYISRMLSFRGTSFEIMYVREDPSFTTICKDVITLTRTPHRDLPHSGPQHRLFEPKRACRFS